MTLYLNAVTTLPTNIFLRIAFSIVLLLGCSQTFAQTDSLKYPIRDRRSDGFSTPGYSGFDFRDSAFIKTDIQYDPIAKQYYIIEKIGSRYYRKPTFLTPEEFYQIMARRQEADYFKQRSMALTAINKKIKPPKLTAYDKLFDRIFGIGPGGHRINIQPQGSVDITAGYLGQNIQNPTLPENARKTGGFDFDMNANLNVVGSIGNKLKLPISYNTQSNFDFENQIKLDYKGDNDEVIKSIEAGNISFQSKGTLIPSAQSLFGIKTQLQFGKLFLTAAISQQKSQRQSLTVQGGGIAQPVYKRLDDYEENRHFLLGQYFRKNYNTAMKDLPKVNSQVQILRMEVWVTNRTGTTTEARDIAAFSDLGENTPYSNVIASKTAFEPPQNNANNLYEILTAPGQVENNRDPSKITTNLLGYGLKPVEDFEKTFARKLNSNEYIFNPQVGYLSLNGQLQPDEVLAVAYEYTYNGKVYKVGEFSNDIAVDSTHGVQKMLFLKLLKATSQRIQLPIWQLMMKNVYSLDVFGLTQEDFRLTVLYEEPSGGLKRYLPESHPAVDGKSIISILNADRLNNRNDPQPDGNYDYVEGFTVVSQFGRIVFPVLQPFGRDLDSLAFNKGSGLPPQIDRSKYVYNALYDSIKAIAQTYANLNRFVLQGQVKGSSSSDIYLGAFNIPQGSVTLTAGGQILVEGVDYTVDYNLGSVKIINAAITSSGVPVNVQFENNAGFGMQQKSFLGLRADYILKNTATKSIAIGASMVRLNERPYFTKMSYGEDPIRNTMYGFDFSYRSDFPAMNRWLNKLPNYTSSAMSTITAYGEFAYMKPGHPPQIGKGSEGLIYIDDFEGTRNSIDLRFPFVSWALASTPEGRFPEASLKNNLDYGKSRGKLAWYNIEPVLQDAKSNANPLRGNVNELSDPRVRQIYTNELFPNRTTNITDIQTTTFDLAYYPKERGPYNFTTNGLDGSGKFVMPQDKWAGIMRAIDQTDFETGNVEFIEFWVQDPFINTSATAGKLYINLGNVSEDILKDGRRFYENGLPTPNIPAPVDTTAWSKVPINPIQVTQSFSTDPNDRPFQDVGLDGFDDNGERIFFNPFLQQLAAVLGPSSPAYLKALSDPAHDNYVWYRDGRYDAGSTGILGRYKHHNNPQGNSPIAGNSGYAEAATLYPDNEDLNRDNTLNEIEEYYEYEIELSKMMDVGITKYITDKREITPKVPNGNPQKENWYLFRVPIKDFTSKYGNIPDFKSIRFMRMYLTGFDDSVVLRFARLDLVRNQWRQFQYKLDTTGSYNPVVHGNTEFNVLAVNVEENSNRTPIPYKIPPGIERVQELSNNGVNLLMNEQSMSLRFHKLQSHESRAVFKTFNLDLRQFGQMKMFIHAESMPAPSFAVQDGDLHAVIRIGQDFLNNFYEVRIPLIVTKPGNPSPEQIWPDSNSLNLILNDLVNLKLRRNQQPSWSPSIIYREKSGDKTYSVMGNPNLGEVRGILIGIENTTIRQIDAEVWVNELRLSKIDEKGGWAALGRVDFQLSDLGTVTVSANTYTSGFGTIEQRVNERAKDNMVQFDAAANIDAGKLLPKDAGITIPVYASINKTIKSPEYDPFDKDVKLKDKLASSSNKDSVRAVALDQTTIKTLNFTNVKFDTRNPKNKLWSLKNFDFTYSFTRYEQSTPLITQNKIDKHRFGFGYTFNAASQYITPFKKVIKSKSVWLSFIKDFNFNYTPTLIGYRADVQRQFGQFIPRLITTDLSGIKAERVDTTYDKYFTFDRYYNFRYDLTRSINIDFSAVNNARVDEPYGLLDTKEKRDTVKRNFFKGGRNTNYSQRFIVAYTLPLSKFPITDWITARYSYGTTYNWIGASLVSRDFGNVLENSQDNTITGEFDFTRLYSKVRFFRSLDARSSSATNQPKQNQPLPYPTKEEALKDLTGRERRIALRQWRMKRSDYNRMQRQSRLNQPMEMNDFVRTGGKLITMVKRGSVNYTEGFKSRVPGFMDSTKLLGQNWQTMQPGLDYVFGRQPDTSWLNQKFRDGVLSKDSMFNLLYRQTFDQKLSISLQVEPIRDLMIDINLDKSYSKEYSELFKDTSNYPNYTGKFTHNNPLANGGFSVSYISMGTLFEPFNPNNVSATFKEFEANRLIVAKRLAEQNPYWQSLPANQKYQADGFPKGYGRYSQDVLIPAFIAAYSGKDAKEVALLKHDNSNIKTNPFKGIKPMPNWRLTYTGLTRIPKLAEMFSNITFTHGYNGTLSMNSFTSALNYWDPYGYGTPGFIDTLSNNYIPFFLVPNISMQEQFSPLIGIDVTTNSQWNIKFEYRKGRQLSLSLIDYQLSEVRTSEFVVGTAYRKRGFKFPFKLPFMKSNALDNDINFRLDVGVRDDAQSNSRLDQENAYSTGGQKVITIQPSIDYVLNNRVNIKLFFDQRRVIPYISTSPPITTTRAGIQIRIALAP